jgi:hypothetical protein
MEASPPSPQNNRRTLAVALVAGGFVAVAVGIILGLAVDPILFAIAAFGLIDFVLASLFSSGRLGSATYDQRPGEPLQDPDLAAGEATDDPSYNPYARED